MARLNEPPVPVESLESLKRRFIRQNRDLARCNSAQSIKIRSLENELSHQLSENASLRTRILSLENELTQTRGSDMKQTLAAFRTRMQCQFESLIVEFGELQNRSKHRRSSAMSHVVASPKRSPQRREWRNISTLSEVLASQGGTMPTIVEGKYFPRRTMDQTDIKQLIDDAESPDMLPPKTFLDDERASGARPDNHESSNDAELGQLSAVEIRRRRRDSRVHERSDEELEDHPIKAGAKRKLSFADTKTDEPTVNSPRKILGEKVVNTDPIVSPRKATTIAKDNAKANAAPSKPGVVSAKPASSKTTRPPAATPTTRPASRLSTAARPKPVNVNASNEPKDMRGSTTVAENKANISSKTSDEAATSVKAEPQTPKIVDILSPPSTQPSATAPNEQRPGTPPPASIPANNTSADPNGPALAAGGRGSLRRNRAAVSYAEPKINVKMRRPGNLADAVVKKESQLSDMTDLSNSDRPRSVSAGPETIRAAAEMTKRASSHAEATEQPGSPLVDKKQRIRVVSAPLSGMATSTGLDRTGMDIFEVEGTPPANAPAPPPTAAQAATTKLSSRTTRAPRSLLEAKSLPSLPPEAHSNAMSDSRRQTVGPLSLAEGADDALSVREVRLRARPRSSVGAEVGGENAATRSARSVSDLRGERAERLAERRRSTLL